MVNIIKEEIEIEESRIKYNETQRKTRKIDDYFKHISDNSKNDLACEFIIELGNKKYWSDKDKDYWKKMTNVYRRQVEDLEMLVPNFKIASAIIHFDESSPPMHIVGIPVKEKNKYGMELQVGKSDVFTKTTLRELQDKMRTLCIEEFNKEYGLDSVLNSSETNDIIITADSKLSSQDLSKIKNSGKTISFNYNDENKKLLNSWTLDGSKMNDFDELTTGVDFKSNNSKEISKLSNYADGLYFTMKHKGSLPNGTKIKLFVGDKYSNDDKVNVYYYDNDNSKLETIKEEVSVKDGYVEFEVSKGSDYFVTMSKINDSSETVTSTKSTSKLPIIITMILIIVALVVAIIYFIKKKNKNNNNSNNSNNNISGNLNNSVNDTSYNNINSSNNYDTNYSNNNSNNPF